MKKIYVFIMQKSYEVNICFYKEMQKSYEVNICFMK